MLTNSRSRIEHTRVVGDDVSACTGGDNWSVYCVVVVLCASDGRYRGDSKLTPVGTTVTDAARRETSQLMHLKFGKVSTHALANFRAVGLNFWTSG